MNTHPLQLPRGVFHPPASGYYGGILGYSGGIMCQNKKKEASHELYDH
ncbi:hypothetical protein SAMN06296020_11160 [Anoxynatronum buryatiense]|uniref:Uncharacterized protein n=1 Tax=Anoxynatronum buryatiense TaxID=489973 RepID=A0AA46AJM7_9CLOT|nr:hypothetical protein SAMN06296020_11160 [Anoxynatronum buryatiense]